MKKVLFVCIGNACRSQMAEGFAKTRGRDVMTVMSAGLYPASSIPRMTGEIMSDRDIDISGHFPKATGEVPWEQFDVIVNISGHILPLDTRARILNWEIEDPIGASKPVYEQVARQIETLVDQLILELRNGASNSR